MPVKEGKIFFQWTIKATFFLYYRIRVSKTFSLKGQSVNILGFIDK